MPSDLSFHSFLVWEIPPSLPGCLQTPLGCPKPRLMNVLGNSSSSTFLKSCVLHTASMFAGRPLEWLGGIYQVQIHLTEKQNSSVILTSCGERAKERERQESSGCGRRGGAAKGLIEQPLWEEEPRDPTASWAGDNGDVVSSLPHGGHCPFAVVGGDAGANEAALGLPSPAEPSWHRCCLPSSAGV